MITVVRGHDLWRIPKSAKKMFKDRKLQFKDRHKWDVYVDADGYEVDQYDPLNPIYIISHSKTNPHLGSMRIIPLSQKTMLMENFPETTPIDFLQRSDIYECTRFCISKGQDKSIALGLFAAGSLFLSRTKFSDFVAIFDAKMLRVYSAIGVKPKIIGQHTYNNGTFYCGLFNWSEERHRNLLHRSSLNEEGLDAAVQEFLQREVTAHPLAA